MSANWERLIAAALRKQQLWEHFHDHSRSPSILSEVSDSSSSFTLSSRLNDLALDFSNGSFASSQRAPAKLVLVSDFSPAIDIKEAGIVSPKLLGRGTFGSAYTTTMNKGVRVVVKRLSRSLSISELDFKRHMDIAGNVRHEKVVAVRAYFSSEDERLVVYGYYRKTGGNPALVDWETRLKIAIGAARDLGLTNMIETTFVPTARCYAPEVKNTRDVSQASDVYSFGILLLELLSQKSTSHIPGGPQAVDVVKLVNSVKSKVRPAKVFDVGLMKNPAVREEMVKMLQKGIRYAAKSINKRPKISEVVTMLEDLNMTFTGNSVSSEMKVLFFEDSNATFDLEYLLRASAEVLGKDAFATSYKARLDYGNTVMVKRLKDVNATLMEFLQHIDVIGRMRHENVAELRAYYFSEEEVLLVYDFHNLGNLSAWLHGYCAPEVKDTTKVSQASDVYRFGVVLLELVSGKPAKWTEDAGKVTWLVNWVQSFSRDNWIAVVVDIEILTYRDEKEAILQMLQIAMDCVATEPESRPRMPQVVKILEEISGIEPSNDAYEDNHPLNQDWNLLDDLLPTFAL
ncbi:UNVERIFIED_CONTAM: putative inactive receptor kinase [Sesamum radiatum]|uniref:Inactive receptor kinase n=1 Tax=Sesamum radiatum TaxID=300843 RepID=A0AAW2KB74_SESRA